MVDLIVLAVGADIDTSTGDSVFTGFGDPAVVAGLAQYHQRIARLLAATPGSILGLPTAGAGFADLVGMGADTATLAHKAAAAQTTILADPQTESVQACTIPPPTDDTLTLQAAVTLRGTTQSVPLTWFFGT